MDKEQIDQLLSYIKDAVEFSKDQMPDIARQMITYGIISSAVWFVSLASFLVIAWFWIKPWCIRRLEDDDLDLAAWIAVCTTSLGFIVASILIMVATETLLLALFAPKLYVIKSLSNLM